MVIERPDVRWRMHWLDARISVTGRGYPTGARSGPLWQDCVELSEAANRRFVVQRTSCVKRETYNHVIQEADVLHLCTTSTLLKNLDCSKRGYHQDGEVLLISSIIDSIVLAASLSWSLFARVSNLFKVAGKSCTHGS